MALITYTAVFAALIISTILELILVGMPLGQSLLIFSIVGLAGLKAILIALFFQHLKYEPRSLSGLMLLGLLAAMALITISLLSIAHHHGG